MKLQKTLKRLQKLHPKEIDLSLDRIKNLCDKLGNPQKNLKSISVVGTNGKNSTIQAMRSILTAANINVTYIPVPTYKKLMKDLYITTMKSMMINYFKFYQK